MVQIMFSKALNRLEQLYYLQEDMAQAPESLTIYVTEQMEVLALAVLPISPTPEYLPYNPPPPPPNPNLTPPNTKLNALYPDHATTSHLETTVARTTETVPPPSISNPQNPQAPKLKTNEENSAHSESVEPTHDDLQDSLRLVEDQIPEYNSTDSDDRSPGNALDRFRDAAERLFWREQARAYKVWRRVLKQLAFGWVGCAFWFLWGWWCVRGWWRRKKGVEEVFDVVCFWRFARHFATSFFESLSVEYSGLRNGHVGRWDCQVGFEVPLWGFGSRLFSKGIAVFKSSESHLSNSA